MCHGALAHQSTLLCLCRFYSSVLRHLVSDLVSSPVPYFLFFFPPSLLLDHKATALKSYSKSSVPVVKICVQTFMLWLGYLRGNFWNLEILFLLKKKAWGCPIILFVYCVLQILFLWKNKTKQCILSVKDDQ